MIIVGANVYALIAVKAAVDHMEPVVLVLPQDEAVTPTSLIFGEDLGGAELPNKIRIDQEDHTYIEPSDLMHEFLHREDVFVISTKDSITAITSLRVIKDMTGEKQVVFADALPQVCLDPKHQFRRVKVWETITKVNAEQDKALLLTNSDFGEYPWSHCLSIRDLIIKLYPSKPPISGVSEYSSPISTTCTCHRGGMIAMLGPEANWDATVLRESVYPAVVKLIERKNQEVLF